ncbi:hypothetical protein CONCODRAFT_12633 [Conidiobolus coronatus NRRL 28638]|uniref:RNI-like protein n=1 Tax=Conidiobolus coronatus (strain ATCC 28846 / CBS 209.66 / NRRL 28638) TaxID=796925 RepID=A0A137NSJ1_CONC2|nr:hypothetical protein CONCODRAFT_12633 [Conidiobolus coronatus NRRL 28638]|eukprot:KXN65704.1 hypothetical protein CONCODRAFT_12633 [Conidiobolus coronatus NRRL 28638]
MCIANNSKHAQYIKEFKFTEKLNPQRVIQLFKTFRFITNLTIEGVSMSQDQFITMIAPLTQLKQLNLKRLNIRRIIKNRYITEPAVLPLALNKLTLYGIHLDNDAELFLQTINSHKNLVEFKFDDYNTENFLDPFFNNYPTLKAFEFKNYQVDYTQSLIMIFESNPQLISLKLELYNFNCSLISDINLNLINLQEFSFIEPNSYSQISSPIISKFSRPTKIKKLKLCWDKLNECSINSILINCPDLEELSLNTADYYQSNTSKISFSLPNSVKIKKLNISGDRYNQASLNSVLMKCSQLKELEIKLPQEWKECIKIIGLACANLEHLTIWPSGNIGGLSLDETFQELHEIEFLSSNPLYKSTLTHLTLYEYNIYDSKAEYFNNFPKLKCLEYMSQNRGRLSISDIKTSFNKDLWPNYRLDTKIEKYRWEAKLVKLNI